MNKIKKLIKKDFGTKYYTIGLKTSIVFPNKIMNPSKDKSRKRIWIGNRVLIGHNCSIFDNDIHPFDKKERHKQFKNILSSGHPKAIDLDDEEVIIENDVWIAVSLAFMRGVIAENFTIIIEYNPTKLFRRINAN